MKSCILLTQAFLFLLMQTVTYVKMRSLDPEVVLRETEKELSVNGTVSEIL
jgi:hypothetical protein